jgi:hypothetical protein
MQSAHGCSAEYPVLGTQGLLLLPAPEGGHVMPSHSSPGGDNGTHEGTVISIVAVT